MISNEVQKRLKAKRPMVSVTLRMHSDVVDDLKRIAERLGFTGYQPLMRAFIGKSLREELEKLEKDPLQKFVIALKHQGVKDSFIKKAMQEIANSYE